MQRAEKNFKFSTNEYGNQILFLLLKHRKQRKTIKASLEMISSRFMIEPSLWVAEQYTSRILIAAVNIK